MSMKKSNDTIGNRTRDLTACSALPQPTAPPRTPLYTQGFLECTSTKINSCIVHSQNRSFSGVVTAVFPVVVYECDLGYIYYSDVGIKIKLFLSQYKVF
jgi:hypothetical protein